ncbi:Coatomer subunit beta [Heracleum sosnowskyi]|uniref:Coatomer subunit beta n=1 Tax=Heracleum sosnowskyi TaxID=360622 RepID=A0AAD8IMR5_9APIA|nr:Coatomer subunit beta [Heracleum sosnowskyi]KAK1386800.1 Coatomer subunit beta [Heracleum sosnowskyi]
MEKSCSLLVHFDKGTPALASEIKEALEGNDVEAKVDAMKKAIMLLLNGETLPQLFITIVRYVLPSEDHTVQKLLLLYLEIIEKTDTKGRVLPEMILICQNLRNNLQHPNEYIRGVTLRFLCRLNEVEIIEPLIPSVLANLEHRHQFIRRNAILAIMAIYKLPQGEQLLVDAPEMIEKLLTTEQDQSAKRNAFLMLFNCAQDRAINYLLTHVDRVSEWGELLQMVVLELIRKVCRTNKGEKGRYIKIIISLLNVPSAAVIYECAGTLVSLSSAPTAIRAAANTYCQLLLSQSDNNVKLIVLDRLNELKASHRDILVEMVMDVLRALSSPNPDIQRKTLDIVLELITPKNINEVVLTLKKEVMKTQGGELEKNGEYRQMLIQAIHSCAIKFPEVASTVVHLLMDFLGDSNVASAMDVAVFVREIIETNPKLRVSIITRLLDTFYQIRAARVCSCALWIIGEYCLSLSEVESGLATIKQCLGDLPFYIISEEGDTADTSQKSQQVNSITVSSKRPAILADGTYATQSAASETASSAPTVVQGSSSIGHLRSLILSGDFFLGAVISCTLTKLILRLEEVQPSTVEVNKASTQALLIIVSMLQLGRSSFLSHPIDSDSNDRIVLCIRLLCNTGDEIRKIWLRSCRESFVQMLSDKQLRETEEIKAKALVSHAQPDDLIDFYHLKSRKGMSQLELEDEVQDDLKRATGEFVNDGDDANKLNRILQLTGFSDPVYAEAYVTVHHYDIVLDVTIINRTKETLQNLCLELATMGDLKLVERPQNYTLAPESSKQIKANIKVSSTETGVIFGNIVYETSNVLERSVVVLNDIHIDIMDYISPAVCSDAAFRTMWAEFEWENKVAVNTVIQDEKDFLDHIIKATNMKCLTAPSAMEGECGFLAANLYAKSVFGEDALVNLSVEKQADEGFKLMQLLSESSSLLNRSILSGYFETLTFLIVRRAWNTSTRNQVFAEKSKNNIAYSLDLKFVKRQESLSFV